jgi:hypothetical protein
MQTQIDRVYSINLMQTILCLGMTIMAAALQVDFECIFDIKQEVYYELSFFLFSKTQLFHNFDLVFFFDIYLIFRLCW